MFSLVCTYRRSPVKSLAVLARFVPAFLLLATFAVSTDAAELSAYAANRAAEQQTQSLMAMAQRYQRRVEAEEQTLLLEQMIATALERQQLLAQQIEHNPGFILRLALPRQLRAKLPGAVQDLLEQEVELEGTLKVLYEDYEDRSRLLHVLESRGEQRSLHFQGRPPQVQSGTRVRVAGIDIGGAMAVSTGDVVPLTLALDGEGSGSGPALSNTFGEQRTVVLLVNFQDDPAAQPWSIQEAYDLVFGSASDHILENSFGQTWLSGDVYGWYTLAFDQPTDPANCRSTDVAQGAQQAAQDAGVDLSQYDRYIYVFPQTPCFPSGSGTVGGSPSEAWINGFWFQLKTVGHELGHNLGLFHSGALECNSDVTGTDCQIYPYGDTMDIMGNQSVGHFNAYKKERLGWLDASIGEIATATSDGSHTLSAYELANTGTPKTLKILKQNDPATGDTTWYYLEYRQAIGFDNFLAGNDNVLNGIVIREATESEPPGVTSTLLLDMTPESSTYWDWQDPALTFGQSFTDPASGVTITSQTGDGNSATVDVSFAAASCAPADPIMTITPAQGPAVVPGTAVPYSVAVLNADNVGCGASIFDLSAGTPVGWAASFAESSPSIYPGATISTDVTITSTAEEADGIYDIAITAQNSGATAYAGSASVAYVVSQGSSNEPPAAIDDTATTVQDTPVIIDVLANDTDPDSDPLAVVAISQGPHGTVVINSDGTLTHSPKPKFKGQDNFTYSVSDGDQTATATVTVMVNRKSGGNGGGPGGGNGKGGGKPKK